MYVRFKTAHKFSKLRNNGNADTNNFVLNMAELVMASCGRFRGRLLHGQTSKPNCNGILAVRTVSSPGVPVGRRDWAGRAGHWASGTALSTSPNLPSQPLVPSHLPFYKTHPSVFS